MTTWQLYWLTPCRFYDASDVLWGGYTNGSRWNGFLNVLVNEVTFKRLWMSWYGDQIALSEPERAYDWDTMNPNDIPTIDTQYGRLRDLSNCYATVDEHDFD